MPPDPDLAQPLATVFGVIFLAEPARQDGARGARSCYVHRALPVFLDALLALTLQSLIAVAAGSLLAQLPAAARC